ncbi:hypothetical protein UN63_11290 [Oceanisphaera arctica]|uniref:Uncharacterized protein n=1 Tax=Oceanisphaera arctica TaxID=641510 RepID=A0A2P5TKQ2_9GAMM|nr:hypothetical protein UN63_11290 [Oceanisphaera arctica]
MAVRWSAEQIPLSSVGFLSHQFRVPDDIEHQNLINVPDDAMVDLANDSTGQLQDTAKPTVDSRDAVVEHRWASFLASTKLVA